MPKKLVMFSMVVLLSFFVVGCAEEIDEYENLLVNGDFEEVLTDGLPAFWSIRLFSGNATASVDTTTVKEGKGALKIQADESARMRVFQRARVIPGETYTVSLDVKTENVVPQNPSASVRGALVRIDYFIDGKSDSHDFSDRWEGTNDWFPAQFSFVPPAGATEVDVELFLWLSSGTVWYDNVTLVRGDGSPSD